MTLTANELTWMRDELENTLPDACVILSKTSVQNGSGGLTDTWGTASVTIGRIDTVTVYRADQAGKLQSYTSQQVTLPYNASLTTDNRLEIGGSTYTVTGVSDGSWKIDTRARVEKL